MEINHKDTEFTKEINVILLDSFPFLGLPSSCLRAFVVNRCPLSRGGKSIVSDNNQRLRRYLATAAIYLAVAASVFGFNVIRSRAARQAAQPAQPAQPAVVSTTPYFSLTTNRTYSPNETARLWASYQNIDYLDFRVYHVKDP